MRCRSAWPTVLTIVPAMGATQTLAHGTGDRYDLPLPLSYYVVGSALIVALSFVVMATFVYREPRSGRYPYLELLHLRDGRRSPLCALKGVLHIIGVLVLAVTIVTGLFGNQHPPKNLAPTLIWVAWWVGLALFVALVANVWPALNPWNTLSRWSGWGALPALSALRLMW